MPVSATTSSTLLSHIQRRREQLLAARLANQKVSEELRSVERQLTKVNDKNADDVKVAKYSLTTAKTALVSRREKVQKKQDCADALERFLAKLGVTIGFFQEDGEANQGRNQSIHFSGLGKNREECVIFFSVMRLPFFQVVAAKPKHPRFNDLAAEVNESQDFLYLILKARQYFLQCIENSDVLTFGTKSTKAN